MKHTFKLLLLLTSLFTLWSCEKDENRIYIEEGTPPVLSSSKTGSIPLSFANENEEAVKLSWTNPDFQFTTGLSSHDVNYLLEIDTTGANFTSPIKQTVAIKNNLSKTFTQGELNNYLLNALLRTGMPHNIEMRVIASLGSNSVALVSNVLKFAITPYAIPPKVVPPDNSTLWMTGDAAPSGWANPLPAPYATSQKFTKITETLYELTVDLPGGGRYKLIQEQGNWGTQYHMLDGGNWENGDFEKADKDPGFFGPPSAGKYKITVNFQTGRYSATKI
jgi:starch-binding outer membrane protein SusE/F